MTKPIFDRIQSAICDARLAEHIPQTTDAEPRQSVDVGATLEAMARAHGREHRYWRESIVELMELLGLNADLPQREQLARELDYPGPADGSAKMNMWLLHAVMRELDARGCEVPPELTT